MRDLEERGVIYPSAPDDSNRQKQQSDDVVLECPPKLRKSMSPPVAAESHIEDKRVNYGPTISLNSDITQLLDHPEIRDGLSSGWIIPLQQFLKLELTPNGTEETGRHIWDMVQNTLRRTDPETGENQTIVTIRTYWVPDVTDGMSLLVTNPYFVDDDDYTVLTTIIDPDKIPMYIDVPILFRNLGEINLESNTPIAQVIPVPRSLLRAETRIVPPETE